MLFVSDIAVASGRQLERRFLEPPNGSNQPSSSIGFAEERPSSVDWERWRSFWVRNTLPGLFLKRPLGEWVAESHRQWSWTYHRDWDVIERSTSSGPAYYVPAGERRTRGDLLYVCSDWTPDCPAGGRPCSVEAVGSDAVKFLSTGPATVGKHQRPMRFLDRMKEWGGDWMWENVRNEGNGLDWVANAMREGTAVWVTDGSYNKKVAPDVSGAGWLVYCTKRSKKLFGSFYERSPQAGSYRAELLGLLAVHTVILAMEDYHGLDGTVAKACCNNEGALFKSKETRRRIPTGASQADIKRSLRNVKANMKTRLRYEWVESHQDRYKP